MIKTIQCIKVFKNICKYYMYVIGCLISIIIRVVPISVGDYWNEVWNDIAIGCFCSLLVALLIQVSVDKRQNIINRKIACNIFEDLYRYIFNYIKLPVTIAVYKKDDQCINDAKKTFSEWCDIANARLLSEPEFSKRMYDYYETQINNIHEALQRIDTNYNWMLHEEILEENEIDFFNSIKSLFNTYWGIDLSTKENGIEVEMFKNVQHELTFILCNHPKTREWCNMELSRNDYYSD